MMVRSIIAQPLCMILVPFFLLSHCKSRVAGSAGSKIKHQIGKTSVAPVQEFSPCIPSAYYTDAQNYARTIADHIMKSNPETFKGPYQPEKICLSIYDAPSYQASSTSEDGRLTLQTGLFFLADDQTDADLAMVIAHELAHITMQHPHTTPKPTQLPGDVDHEELERRLNLQSVYADRKLNLEKSISINARTEGIYDDYLWLVFETTSIVEQLRPLVPASDSAFFHAAVQSADGIRSRLPEISMSTRADSRLESKLVVQANALVTLFTQNIETVARLLAHPNQCHETMPCDLIQRLGRIASYHALRVEPVVSELITGTMPVEDDPLAYPPFAQWYEQEADEVGFEFYLRAGFKAERYGTYWKAAMQLQSQQKLESCMQDIKNSIKPQRTGEEPRSVHPNHCFRLYNIAVSEMLIHSDIYADLSAKAQTLNLPETVGQLTELRRAYSASRPISD